MQNNQPRDAHPSDASWGGDLWAKESGQQPEKTPWIEVEQIQCVVAYLKSIFHNNNKKKTIQVKSGQKTQIDISPKWMSLVSLIIGEMQIKQPWDHCIPTGTAVF